MTIASTPTILTTMTDAAAALRSGEVTSVELVQQAISVADELDASVGMFIDRYAEQALVAAAEADAELAAGKSVGPLHGLPLGIKDIITTSDGPTTAQSVVHDPASFTGDAVVVERLKGAGGIVMGKLTTMEFAIGAPDETKPFPVPRNAWSLDHWAGGSSSGSGSSVALGAVLGALGTDTGGSIRIPAAFNGITGLMPTYGRVPKSGCVPLGFTLDHIGPMARSAADCALMFDVLAGADISDPTSIDVPISDYTAALTGDLTGLKIGIDRLDRVSGDLADPAVAPAFDAAVAVLASLGAEIVELELPFYEEMTVADFVMMLSEAAAYHLPDLQTKWHDYGAPTRAIISQGVMYSASDYVQAARARRVGVKAITELLNTVDVILTPTASAGATSFEDLNKRGVFQAMGAMHTGYWDSTGNPVITFPNGFTATGLPLGLQVAGKPFDEATLLRVGDAFQSATDWHLRAPALLTTKEETA